MNEDIETMLSLADVLKNISMSIKSFPQPYIIIKSEIHKHFNPFHIYVASDEQPKKKSSVIKETAPEKTSPTSTASTQTEKEETPREIESASKPASHQEEKPQEDVDYTNDELLAKLANTIDKTSLRGLVKSFCLIERQETDTIYFVVLQKIQLGILQKQENLRSIEAALSIILGRHVSAAMRYQSKDEYFSSLL